MIAMYLYIYFLSEERVLASKMLPGPSVHFHGNKDEFLDHLRKALYASKIISYTQGLMLLREASKVILMITTYNIIYFSHVEVDNS